MKHWLERLRDDLEPILLRRDPRPGLSAYHGMPCAVFHYPPEDEFAVRAEVRALAARLAARGKAARTISLADCLAAALQAEAPLEELAASEQASDLDAALDTVNAILADADRMPLDRLVLERLADAADPERDIVYIVRCGALFPFYRPYPLTDHLMNKVTVPTVLFYPGEPASPTTLRFMGELTPDNNYRAKIF